MRVPGRSSRSKASASQTAAGCACAVAAMNGTAIAAIAAIEAAAGQKLKMTGFPWTIFAAMGVFMPVMKGIVEMRYLWDNELGLVDPRLDALLGEDFGAPYDAAIATVVAPYFAQNRLAA